MSDSPASARAEEIKGLFAQYVVPTYGRFDLVMERGEGRELWDVDGKRYLDLGSGIAVCSLGHSNPELADAISEQARSLVHCSNLYYYETQGRLAQRIVEGISPGKVFFCNSGAEANETLYKLARKFGSEEGRFEIITASDSFHGRTLAGIAATGQEKVKKGFEPLMPGFKQVAFNDLAAVEAAISPGTVAVLIEGVQGEGGIHAASPEYLLGLRKLCDERNLLLLWDGVQCGHFRTGRFQSFQRILEGVEGGEAFLPDAIAMAKSLGGGFPMGAVWIRQAHADVLGPGSHGTTFGGTPLACAVAHKILDVVERDSIADHAREIGALLKTELERIADDYPQAIKAVRGLGLMIGFELNPELAAFAGESPASIQFVNRLHDAGLLTIPSGAAVVRLLPPLNLTEAEAREGLAVIETEIRKITL